MNSAKHIYFIIIGLSSAVFGFLVWLLYFHTKNAAAMDISWVELIPIFNAFFNTLTATFLIIGYLFVKRQEIELHKKMMIAATISSVCFFIGYIAYHYYHGDTKFLTTGIIRPIYFTILITHIALSAVQVPLILSTLYLGFTEKTLQHKRVARITFPIWLYVSMTGVLIFIFLRWFNTVV